MEKYVYDITKTITKDELLEILKNINYLNPNKEDILNIFNIDTSLINEQDLANLETVVRVKHDIKDLKTLLTNLHFSILECNEYELHVGEKRKELFETLRFYKIKLEYSELLELAGIVKMLVDSDEVIDYLNKNYIDDITVEKAIRMLGIDISNEIKENLLKLLTSVTMQELIYLPTEKTKFYDENDYISYKVEVDTSDTESTNLREFKGVIYEKVEHGELNEINEKINADINPDEIDSDYTTFMRFIGEEENNSWRTFMEIKKQKNTIMVDYFEHFPIVNENNDTITVKELSEIITLLIQKTPSNQFLKYVIRELKTLEKVIRERGYVKSGTTIEKDTLESICAILSDDSYGNDRNIRFKAKLISSTPLKLMAEEKVVVDKTITKKNDFKSY